MIVWAAVLGLVVTAQAAQEESLAEKAERAKAKKPAPAASPSAPAKVFTNDDLINAKGNVVVLPAPEGEEPALDAGTAATATRPEPTEEEKRAQAGAALQKQIDEQAETIKVAQAAIADWERELSDLTNYTFGTKRAAVMQSIDEARKVVADAQKSIVDLEEQARRQGVRVTLP